MHHRPDPAALMPAASAHPNQTWTSAKARAQRVSEIETSIHLDLLERSSVYRGRVEIRFRLKGAGDLPLDYQGRKVLSIEANGKKVGVSAHKKNQVKIPGRVLRPGGNFVAIEFESDYDNDGAGLHKSLDPIDQAEYFYATLEPFDCNRIFPCFDQPDLKSTYTLSVSAPRHWQVIANGREISVIDEGERRVHRFEPTLPFSTYIFGLCAGPYAVWTDPEARIPSRIFAPQSQVPYCDTEELFEITRQGFDFFEAFFEIPYPFHKYDQIFCPHFNWGAMENVACVCHNDRYLFRHQATEVERQRRANTILHEMAHMWFGNLVTMEWWNDLWLNESFATFMANLALVEATRFTSAWDAFYQSTKSWAYWQDELPTTHPIETEVPDTDTTHTNFDGITYGKGASVLKQLAFYIGLENFRKGVASYLKEFSWGNAKRKDFLDHLGKAAGKDMKKWTKLWLQSSGTNTLTPEFQVQDGKLKSFQIVQGKGNGDQVLRPHRTTVGLYKKTRGKMKRYAAVDVSLDKARNKVAELVGEKAPDFVSINDGDQAFAKVYLDPASLAFATESLEVLPETMLRGAVWRSLWNMVRDGVESPRTLVDLFLAKAPLAEEAVILQSAGNSVLSMASRYLGPERGAAALEEIHIAAWKAVREAPQGSDLQKVWFSIFLQSSNSPKAIDRLGHMLRGTEFIRGLDFDQEKRWSSLVRMSAFGHPDVDELLAVETKNDPSDRGRNAIHKVRVARPDEASKHAAFEKIVHDLDNTLDRLRSEMSVFWWPHQLGMTEVFAKRFFQEAPKIEKGRGPYFVDAFLEHMYPSLVVDAETLKMGQKLVAKKGLAYPIRRALLEKNYELELALRARSRD